METTEIAAIQSCEYPTFPRRFLAYRWYKPLLVALLATAFWFVFQMLILLITMIWFIAESGLTANTVTFDTLFDVSASNYFTGAGAILGFGSVAAMLGALALAALIVRDRPFSSYSSSRGGFNWRAFFKCLGVAAVIFLAFTVFEIVAFPDQDASGTIQFTIAGLVLCAVLVPLQCVAEEYVFRGLILQTVSSWTKLPVVGIVVSAAVFACAHEYNLDGLFAIFAGAVLWGVLAWKTSGIEATCAAHIMNNMVGVYAVGFGFMTLADASSEIDIASMLVAIAIDVVYCVAVILLDRKFNWFAPKGDGAAEANAAYQAKTAVCATG